MQMSLVSPVLHVMKDAVLETKSANTQWTAAHQAPRVSEHEGTRTEHSHVQMQTIVALVLLLLPTYKLSFPGLLEYLLLSRSVQSCLTLCNLKPSSPPGASVRGIFQARILERVAILLLQGIFPIQGRTRVS